MTEFEISLKKLEDTLDYLVFELEALTKSTADSTDTKN